MNDDTWLSSFRVTTADIVQPRLVAGTALPQAALFLFLD
jgi:hypothetical protein